MSHESNAPLANNEARPTQIDLDVPPLTITPEQQHLSPIGGQLVRTADRVNGFLERNNEARHNAVEWTKNSVEQAREQTKSVFRSIGHGALRSAKFGLKAAAFVPLTGIALGVMAGEAGVSVVKSGINSVKDVGEAVNNKATNTVNAVAESINRGVERGKDSATITREKVRIGLGKLPLSMMNIELGVENEAVEKATRQREEAEAKEHRAIERRNSILEARNSRIEKADQGYARIIALRAKWNNLADTSDVEAA